MAEEIDAFGYFDLTPQEQSSETSAITAAMAGIISGVIKVPEGVVSLGACLLYTSPSPRDGLLSRMPSSA